MAAPLSPLSTRSALSAAPSPTVSTAALRAQLERVAAGDDSGASALYMDLLFARTRRQCAEDAALLERALLQLLSGAPRAAEFGFRCVQLFAQDFGLFGSTLGKFVPKVNHALRNAPDDVAHEAAVAAYWLSRDDALHAQLEQLGTAKALAALRGRAKAADTLRIVGLAMHSLEAPLSEHERRFASAPIVRTPARSAASTPASTPAAAEPDALAPGQGAEEAAEAQHSGEKAGEEASEAQHSGEKAGEEAAEARAPAAGAAPAPAAGDALEEPAADDVPHIEPSALPEEQDERAAAVDIDDDGAA